MLRKLSLVILVLAGAFTALPAHAAMTEQQKIDALLDAVASPDITFVRNGTPMSGKDARAHLQDKIKEIKPATAEDFITKVASQSRESGKPYMIKMKDGTEVESGKWLHGKLAEIEKK